MCNKFEIINLGKSNENTTQIISNYLLRPIYERFVFIYIDFISVVLNKGK